MTAKFLRFILIIDLIILVISSLGYSSKAARLIALAAMIAIVSTAVIMAAIYWQYQNHPKVKEKKKLQNRKRDISNAILRRKAEQESINKKLREILTLEKEEIDTTLRVIQQEFITKGLRESSIISSSIQGIGPKLKEKLRDRGIRNALDIGEHISKIDGFGPAKVQSLLGWRNWLEKTLETNKPKEIPESNKELIHGKYSQAQRELAIQRRESEKEFRGLSDKLPEIDRQLDSLGKVNFTNFIGFEIWGTNRTSKAQNLFASSITFLLPVFALCQTTLGLAALGKSLETPTPTFTMTFTATWTGTATGTSTITNTPTITFTPTGTWTPTITWAPTITSTSTGTSTSTRVPTSTAKPTSTRMPTATNLPASRSGGGTGGVGGVCNCSIDYDCGNFSTHSQAQACFESCGGSPSYNWSRLDRDRDGIACESLP